MDIKDPFLSGAREECVGHYRQSNGNKVIDLCCANIIGVLTRDCRKIQTCNKYCRNYKAGAMDIKKASFIKDGQHDAVGGRSQTPWDRAMCPPAPKAYTH